MQQRFPSSIPNRFWVLQQTAVAEVRLNGFAAASKRTGKPESAMAEIPAKRFGTPAELGQTCAFLCSVHAAYITGQNILLDGGVYPAAF
jgi:NAD(P)-dependent dehydrogenase (short-subunit alcohol dehydrogenase family)